jgi:hypothetical protein
MFDSTYADNVSSRLDAAYSPYSRPGTNKVCIKENVVVVEWQPGDGTRYKAIACIAPDDNSVYVLGRTLGESYVFEAPASGFLHTSYFLSKCPLSNQTHYTKMKICQLVASMLQVDTDADDPEQFQK